MLTVAPRGIQKRTTLGSIFSLFSKTENVTGIVARLELVPKTVTRASEISGEKQKIVSLKDKICNFKSARTNNNFLIYLLKLICFYNYLLN